MELDDEETPKLERGIVEMEQKLEEQKKLINGFINAQANYDSKFLSSNLDYLLKMYGLRISDLEGLLGVSAGYVSRTVNPDSKKRLSVDIVWKISAIFQVNVDNLLNIDFQIPTQSLCDELFKSVKLHESDFVISESAKSLNNRYLNPKRNNADGFMNIPDSIDEELPFN